MIIYNNAYFFKINFFYSCETCKNQLFFNKKETPCPKCRNKLTKKDFMSKSSEEIEIE